MNSKYAEVWNRSHEYWATIQHVEYDNWMSEYEQVIDNAENIIDLGCGGSSASNTRYLLTKNKNVISCDFSESALKIVQKIPGAQTKLFDMLDTFPFEDNFADIVIADLSLHYFTEQETFRVLKEIKRVLKATGFVFFRLNSTNSTEYKKLIENKVKEIETRLFFTNDLQKRFFNEDDVKKYFNGWEIISLTEENMTRWSSDKIVWKGIVQVNK